MAETEPVTNAEQRRTKKIIQLKMLATKWQFLPLIIMYNLPYRGNEGSKWTTGRNSMKELEADFR